MTAPTTTALAPVDDPICDCTRGNSYRFVHHGPDGGVVETAGVLRIVCTRAVLVDTGEINLAVIARSSILSAPEVH